MQIIKQYWGYMNDWSNSFDFIQLYINTSCTKTTKSETIAIYKQSSPTYTTLIDDAGHLPFNLYTQILSVKGCLSNQLGWYADKPAGVGLSWDTVEWIPSDQAGKEFSLGEG